MNTDSRHFPREEVKSFLDKKKISHRSVPAGTIAQGLGAPLSSNLALLGYFSAFGEAPVTHEEMRNTIEKISPDQFREINLKVFDAGHERGMEERQG